jgi:hypothetical protein
MQTRRASPAAPAPAFAAAPFVIAEAAAPSFSPTADVKVSSPTADVKVSRLEIVPSSTNFSSSSASSGITSITTLVPDAPTQKRAISPAAAPGSATAAAAAAAAEEASITEAHGAVNGAPWYRVLSALEHRNMAYKNLTWDTLLIYHKRWLEQKAQPRLNVRPDAATLDSRGEDLPLDKLEAASQSQVKELAAKASAAIATDRNLHHIDRYVYCFDTKAPPLDWLDVLPHLVSMHEANSGFLLIELGLAPTSSDDRGLTYLSGFVEDQYAHFLKCALDSTLECSTYMLDPSAWIKGARTDQCDGADRLVSISNGMRQFRRFPSEEPAVLFRRFMTSVNRKLAGFVTRRCVLLTAIDHRPGRREWLPKMVAKILRNRLKPSSATSKTRGLNFYVPAVQCLRRERDERQRLHFVRGLQAFLPTMNIKELLEMPLDELRVRYWTYHQPSSTASTTTTTASTTTASTTTASTTTPEAPMAPATPTQHYQNERSIAVVVNVHEPPGTFKPSFTSAKIRSQSEEEDDCDEDYSSGGNDRKRPLSESSAAAAASSSSFSTAQIAATNDVELVAPQAPPMTPLPPLPPPRPPLPPTPLKQIPSSS